MHVALLAGLIEGLLPQEEAAHVARGLLDRFGTLQRVLSIGPDTIELGNAADTAIAARLRLIWSTILQVQQPPDSRLTARDHEMLKSYIRGRLAGRWGESAIVMFFSVDETMLPGELLFEGQLSATTLDPRRIFHRALDLGAVSILFAHTHPSGDAEPSASDLIVTRGLVRLGAALNIRVLDHMILSQNGDISLRERGLL